MMKPPADTPGPGDADHPAPVPDRDPLTGSTEEILPPPATASLGRTVAAAAGLIAVVTLLSRAAGFARTLIFSSTVGASEVGGIYQAVNTIPNVVFEVAAGGVLAAVAVPIIAGRLGAQDRAGADRAASALLTWAIAVLLPLSVLLALAAPALSRLLLRTGGSSPSHELGEHLLVIFAPQVVLYGIGIVLIGILQAHRRFLAAALAPLLSSLVVIAAYLLFPVFADGQRTATGVPDDAVAVLAWGTTLGVVVLSLPLFVPALRAGIRLRPTWTFPEGTARRASVLASAGLLALVAQQVAVLATIWLARGSSAPGTVNVYAYLQAIYLLPYAVLAVPIATSVFPALAQSEGDGKTRPDAISWSLRGILVLCGGAAAVLVAVSRSVGVFFANLDAASGQPSGASALAGLPGGLVAYSPGLIGFGAAALLTRALYVRGRASLAGAAVAVGWAVAALGPLALLRDGSDPSTTLRTLGVFSTVGMTLAAILLTVLVRRSWGNEATEGVSRTLGALIVAFALAVGVGDALSYALDPRGLTGSLGAGLLAGFLTLIVYLVAIAVGDRGTVGPLLRRGRARRGR